MEVIDQPYLYCDKKSTGWFYIPHSTSTFHSTVGYHHQTPLPKPVPKDTPLVKYESFTIDKESAYPFTIITVEVENALTYVWTVNAEYTYPTGKENSIKFIDEDENYHKVICVASNDCGAITMVDILNNQMKESCWLSGFTGDDDEFLCCDAGMICL